MGVRWLWNNLQGLEWGVENRAVGGGMGSARFRESHSSPRTLIPLSPVSCLLVWGVSAPYKSCTKAFESLEDAAQIQRGVHLRLGIYFICMLVESLIICKLMGDS